MLPLSLAISCMRFAREMHSAPTFKRPFVLRKVYFARFTVYMMTFSAMYAGTREWKKIDTS